jgi:hypothetical protein
MNEDEARQKIIQAANRQRYRFRRGNKALFGARHIQNCVAIVRRRNLVDPEILIAAGFQPLDKHIRRMKRKSRKDRGAKTV